MRLQRHRKPVAGQRCLGEPDRLAGGPVAVDIEGDALAERLLDVGALGNDAGNGAVGGKGDVPWPSAATGSRPCRRG